MDKFILGIPEADEPSIIFRAHSGKELKEVMRLNKNGVTVNPDMPLDEAAQHVIKVLDAQIQHLVRSEREAILKLADSLGWVSVDDIRARGNT
jgi:hypothetical protein